VIRTIIMALVLAFGLSQAAFADTAKVNINTATAEQLAEVLSGIGQAKAEAIVEYRNQNGAFEHIDELVNVKGIGLRTVDRNRDRIELGPED